MAPVFPRSQMATSFCFVIPPFVESQGPKAYRWDPQNISIAYLAAVLEREGVRVSLIDLTREPVSRLDEMLVSDPPDFVGMTVYTKFFDAARWVASRAKRIAPDATVVVGGPHATAIPEETLRSAPAFDACVVGEGEETVVELVRGDPLDQIRGIAYRDPGDPRSIVRTPPRPFIQDLDSLPFPAWHYFPTKHNLPYGDMVKWGKRELPVLTQRGCPYGCVFCQKVLGNRVRHRSIENILAEIEHDVRRYGATHVMFYDETFGTDEEKVRQLCRRLISSGLSRKIKWACYDRVTSVNELTLRLMRAAGCQFIFYGIEASDDATLRAIRKGSTYLQQREAVKLTRKVGIKAYLSVILGHPGETPASLRRSVDHALKLRGTFYQFGKMVPFPGTKVFQWANERQRGLKLPEKLKWRDFDPHFSGSLLEYRSLLQRELDFNHWYAYLKMMLHAFPRSVVNFFSYVNVKSVLLHLARKLIPLSPRRLRRPLRPS
ncbi:MAG: radical SAM protein [Promethearchaeota archaeon]